MIKRSGKTVAVLRGDVLEQLATLPEESVHCVITSPPYWGLRDYGVAGQLGLEETPGEYVEKMVAVFREVKRVLRSDGTLWLNMGGGYIGGGRGGNPEESKYRKQATNAGSLLSPSPVPLGFKPKDMDGMPWRLAFALQADGWWLRQDIVWQKPNPMPESCTDRCTKSHEYVFLLTKAAHYFYDAEAVKEPGTFDLNGVRGYREGNIDNSHAPSEIRGDGDAFTGRNKRSVWTIPTQAYSGAHFATFPEALVEPCILAGTSARGCCPKCGAPWERKVKSRLIPQYASRHGGFHAKGDASGMVDMSKTWTPGMKVTTTIDWRPTCKCGETEIVPTTVCDPFLGSGTVAVVAIRHRRNCIGIELNPKYVKLAEKHIAAVVSGVPEKEREQGQMSLLDGLKP